VDSPPALTVSAAPWLQTWQPAVLWLAGANTVNTRRSYAGPIRALMGGAGLPLEQITAAHVLAYKAAMVARGFSPRTIRHHLIVLSAFFCWAIDGGYYPGPNPVAGVPLPRVGGSLAGVAISQGQVRRLLDAGRNIRDRAVLHLLAATGLRAAELCALQQRDLHFPEIEKVAVHVRAGKGGKSRDVTVAGWDLSHDLTAYLIERRYTGPTTYLFQPLDGRAALGKPLSRDTVYRIVTSCAARAGLGHLSPHDLRRTYATIALDTGEKLPVVQQRMGHAMMEQTARYYRGG
jgi:integrase